MALQLPPDLEQRVIALAQATGREPVQVFADLVADALDTAELARHVAISDAEFERGEGIPHEQVVQKMRAVIERFRR